PPLLLLVTLLSQRATRATEKMEQDTLFLFDLDSLFGRIGMDRRSICAAPQYCGKDNRMGQISHVHMSILIR
ncbi:hypothetical protein, partial [Bradyrhizobium ottawaense]|uniref:hypothetical protein n=1 Tax=Bradyrhizobium ottawaense TaxID=931866 RepID=UPI0030C75ADB